MERFDATGRARKASDKCSFAKVVETERLVQREERVRQGCLKRVCPKFCTDAKPYKHTQTLTLRKARGIVRFGEVMRGERCVIII